MQISIADWCSLCNRYRDQSLHSPSFMPATISPIFRVVHSCKSTRQIFLKLSTVHWLRSSAVGGCPMPARVLPVTITGLNFKLTALNLPRFYNEKAYTTVLSTPGSGASLVGVLPPGQVGMMCFWACCDICAANVSASPMIEPLLRIPQQ